MVSRASYLPTHTLLPRVPLELLPHLCVELQTVRVGRLVFFACPAVFVLSLKGVRL